MVEKHIVFEELEFDDPVDEAHLEHCQECRRQWELFRFLGRQVKSAPKVEVPPFFAKRVGYRVQASEVSFDFLFEWAARRLIPLFMVVLLIVASVLLVGFVRTEFPEGEYSDLFYSQPLLEEVSWEEVVGSLGEGGEEESLP